MTLFVQSPDQPSNIPLAFDLALSGGLTEVRWAVAYVSREGCRQLVERMEHRLRSRWASAMKEVVTCCDYGITEPGAIDFLRGIPNCVVKLASDAPLSNAAFLPIHAFHPKLYMFRSGRNLNVVVGSANLTVRALTSNREAVEVRSCRAEDAEWQSIWRTLTFGSLEITDELLDRYRQARQRRCPAVEIDPPIPQPPAIQMRLPNFWNAVRTGRLDPAAFNHFWIEAGSMSSSASHNQLELPRGGNLFFGFDFDDYAEDQADVGAVTFTISGRPFPGRKLAWHGDNGMERAYLPTEAQSGVNYRDQCILFRRRSAEFELEVVPWDSGPSAVWRTLSQRVSRVYRIGDKSPRICGFY